LKNSTRNELLIRSVIAVFLNTPESQATSPGPNRAFLAEFPNVYGAGMVNASGANQRSIERLDGSAAAYVLTRLARLGSHPSSVGVKLTEYGVPVPAVRMPATCHPPTILPAGPVTFPRKRRPLPNGSS